MDFDLTSETQNGITAVVMNPNFSNFAAPVLTGHAAADAAVRLLAGNGVPEPGSLALLSLALAGLGFSRRRKLH